MGWTRDLVLTGILEGEHTEGICRRGNEDGHLPELLAGFTLVGMKEDVSGAMEVEGQETRRGTQGSCKIQEAQSGQSGWGDGV